MRSFGVIVTFLVTLALTNAFSLTNDPHQFEREMKGIFHMLEGRAARNATFRKLLEKHFEEFDQKPTEKLVPYDCFLARSPSPPTSAHAVRPGDINAIASIGDSITAGFGITAETIIEVILNDRHLSWITGGVGSLGQDVVTVTNILRYFNPGIAGYSYDESYPEDREAGLNVAVGGAIASDLPGQANALVAKMRDPIYGIDFDGDWKLVSLLIGGNDLCNYCFNEAAHSPEAYVAGIQGALDILYDQVPRVIVVVNNIFDITPLPAFSDNLICDLVQGLICGCAEETELMKRIQREYVQRLDELIDSGRYDRGRQDFTVVSMPHFNKAQPPKLPGSSEVDRSFWSPDCFHPGMKAHFAMGTSTWNQLFEPVGEKREELDWQIGTNIVCPTEADPFIKTRLNSRKVKATEEKPQE